MRRLVAEALANQGKFRLLLSGLRADFLLRIAANDDNGSRAATSGSLRYFGLFEYRLRSHKSARKHLTPE